ncbi:MAG: hypothetical protein J6A60_01475 [Clostridia bacterium]|nr:hypothetical protein [Clostridia bacterium]
MKKTLVKMFSVILVFVLTFTSARLLNASATDDEPEFPCGGVVEEVEVKIFYAPLISRVVIGGFGPVLTGTVLRITYPNGESEFLTVEQNGNEYYAGDFLVYINYFGFEPVIIDYGIVSESIYITSERKQQYGSYSGEADFIYLNLPTFADIVYLISAYFRIWF